MLRYCANLKAVRYESTSLNRIVADKWHRVIVALDFKDAAAPRLGHFHEVFCLFLVTNIKTCCLSIISSSIGHGGTKTFSNFMALLAL